MNADNNICTICGGVLRFEWTIAFEQCRPHAMRYEPALPPPFRLCPGHDDIRPKQWHDGKLDEHGDAWVSLDDPYVSIGQAGLGEVCSLTACQTLSLLAWLLQERSTLERMVKERSHE
jgi:hypothetical protein